MTTALRSLTVLLSSLLNVDLSHTLAKKGKTNFKRARNITAKI